MHTLQIQVLLSSTPLRVRNSASVISLQILRINMKTAKPDNLRADLEQIPEELHTSQPQQKILHHQISQTVLDYRNMTPQHTSTNRIVLSISQLMHHNIKCLGKIQE
jgi:hypothetical protein